MPGNLNLWKSKMMMIINSINAIFFAYYIRRYALLILLLAQLASCTKNENFQIKSIKTTSGWGYTIENRHKTIIKQTVIPVISDNKSFHSEEDALKVADLVVKKLSQNTSPSITKNDLILLKIII